jgi:SAM-dependent methyltransferase
MSGFKDHFSQLATGYAQFRPVYPAALFSHLAGLCAARQRAWDCACGNGQASVDLAAHFEAVIATDGSAEQIAASRPHPRVQYRAAQAEDPGLAAQSIDLVTVAQALHWLDLPRFYAQVHRVLRPGGVLAVWCYGRLEVEGATLNERVQHFYTHVIGPYWPPGREHVENGYTSLPFPFAPLPAPGFHIEIPWTLAHFAGYVRSWSATARCQLAQLQDPVRALVEELIPLWGEGSRCVRWPLALRAGRMEP